MRAQQSRVAGALVAMGSVTVVICGAAAGGCARNGADRPVVPGPAPAPLRSTAAPIAGVVVNRSDGHPLRGVTVAVAGAVAQTGDDGRFTFPLVPPTYDLTVVAHDHASALVVHGLHRVDPVIAFEGRGEAGPRHTGHVSGTLSGAFVGKGVSVSLSLPETNGSARVKLPSGGASAGVPYDLGTIEWWGADTVAASVLALAQTDGTAGAFARKPVVVHDGETATVDLVLAPARSVPRGAIDVVMDDPGLLPPIHEHYRDPLGGRLFNGTGPTVSGRRYSSLDLTPAGLTLCTESFEWNPYIRSMHMFCGRPLEQPMSLVLRAAPAFTSPPFGTLAARGMSFTWSAVPRSVYLLAIGPTDRSDREHPRVIVEQAGTSATWPDLADLGVAFPRPLQPYAAAVSAVGPFGTVDDACGPTGLAAVIPAESWTASSQELSLPVLPPLGKEEAACHPAANAVVCNQGTGVDDRELYVLEAMNRLLRYFPAFANDVGIHCVRNCDEARAYMKAYQAYSAAHPGFDADMPLEETGPPPPRPWLKNVKRAPPPGSTQPAPGPP